ncbi:hypothetical protein PIB30_062958 [Stylosanthes scabra]|uniref:Transposase (Putative), gypsy type n=1 Tax=Stylosanthes scabra TaxID=79078 RepID=A0ABU6UPY5_9FABA|nr:hypothetical protein [Stylosanthes scabra]
MEGGRLTDENGKPVVPIESGDPYSWVKGEVREQALLFQDKESVSELGDHAVWVRKGERAKGVRKGGLLTLNNVQGRSLFVLYRSSYKDFKQMYVKVRSPEKDFPFYVDECLLERFPLHWFLEPVQILGMAEADKESALVIDFLDQYVCPKGLLSLSKLLRWEKDMDSVFEYLDTTTGGLKNFFKMKVERELSVSTGPNTEKGVVVNQSLEKKRPISMKRRRAEGEATGKSRVIDLTSSKCCGKEVSLDEVKSFTRNQQKLHGYVGEEDLMSVWSEHFPFLVMAEEHFQSKTDFDFIGSVDDLTRAQYMQVCAARLLCVGRFEELKAKREAEQKREESAEIERSMEREKKLQLAMEQIAKKEKQLLGLKNENSDLNGKLQTLEKNKTELETRVVELCGQKKSAEVSKEEHGYDMLHAGFERAKKQAEFLFPDVIFDKLDPIKAVHNGALVDDDEVGVEGGGDHDPEA